MVALVARPSESRRAICSLIAIRFAMSMNATVYGVYVQIEGRGETIDRDWDALIRRPAQEANAEPPELRIVRSPYRRTVKPLLRIVHDLERTHHGRAVAVVIPEPVEPHWYQMWIHSQRATLLKIALLMRGGPGIAVINTPWYVTDAPVG